MNPLNLRKIFLSCICIGRIFADPVDLENQPSNILNHPPQTPQTPRLEGNTINNAPVNLTETQLKEIKELLYICYNQINNIHKNFSEEHIYKPTIKLEDINKLLKKLEPCFINNFQVRGVRFTPLNKKNLANHIKSIRNDSPDTFLSKGSQDFEKTINSDDFSIIITTEKLNKCYIPKWVVSPESGFAYLKKIKNNNREIKISNNIVSGITNNHIEYEDFNIYKLLNKDPLNPHTKSGALDFHHVYQQPDVVVPVCYNIHKKQYSELHKANLGKGRKRTKIVDRSTTCASEVKKFKQLIGLVLVGRMCGVLLSDQMDLDYNVTDIMNFFRDYKGNVDCIKNPKDNTNTIVPNNFFAPTANMDIANMDIDKDYDGETSREDESLISHLDIDRLIADSLYKEESTRDSSYSDQTTTSSSSSSSRSAAKRKSSSTFSFAKKKQKK